MKVAGDEAALQADVTFQLQPVLPPAAGKDPGFISEQLHS